MRRHKRHGRSVRRPARRRARHDGRVAASAGWCAAPGGKPHQDVGRRRVLSARSSSAGRTYRRGAGRVRPRYRTNVRRCGRRERSDDAPVLTRVNFSLPKPREGPRRAPISGQSRGFDAVTAYLTMDMSDATLSNHSHRLDADVGDAESPDEARWRELVAQISVEIAGPLTAALERVHALTSTGRIDRHSLRALREEVERAREAGMIGTATGALCIRPPAPVARAPASDADSQRRADAPRA